MNEPARTFGLRKTYRRLILMASGLLIFAGALPPVIVMLHALKGQIGRLDLILLVGGFPFLVLCLWLSHLCFASLRPNELRLDPSGLRWKTGFFTLETGWDNVAAIGPVDTGQGKRPGLRLHAPPRVQKHGSGLSPFMHEAKGIPMDYFGDLQQGELRQALETFAPQLYAPSP